MALCLGLIEASLAYKQKDKDLTNTHGLRPSVRGNHGFSDNA